MSCLHVYISKFNRCQLIQFCDYCCALSFVSCHFPFVCPLSFLISTAIVGLLFFLLRSLALARSLSTYFFVCGIYSLNVKQQTRNHRSSILVKLFVFLQRSYLIAVPHGSQRCSPSSFSFVRSLTHSFHLIHFILSAFITFLVTFLHLFSVRRCYCCLAAVYAFASHFIAKLTPFFLSADWSSIPGIYYILVRFLRWGICHSSFDFIGAAAAVDGDCGCIHFVFVLFFLCRCAVCANLRPNSRFFFILSHLTHSAHFDDAHNTIDH